ncbi:MAG: DUF4159 domain-containing protein [Planctomycetota bacterium]|nr:DUF4159 domain-containing protein [Planctomycetota bacterium]
MKRLRHIAVALLVAVFVLPAVPVGGEGSPPNAAHGAPPKAKPQRRKGGEGFAPLPLPVTPLRRTEKKKPPSPPTFIAKVKWGSPEPHTGVDEYGRKYKFWDWEGARDDVFNLIRQASSRLGVKYRARVIDIRQFSGNPDDIPVLYFTGHMPIEFDDEMAKRLREYVVNGGYIWAQACCGDQRFYKAFAQQMKKIFADRTFRTLPLDHPVYHCYYDINKMRRTKDGKVVETMKPELAGINIGCRTAVFLSKYDVGCGWAGLENKFNAYEASDSRMLGINMVNYCLAYHKLGKFLATKKVYFENDENERADFTMGQVVHAGVWDSNPSGVVNLLKSVLANTSTEVKFKRQVVNLADADFFQLPLLYITGHGHFSFGEKETDALRRYLRAGGMLLADSCCGNLSFDESFRREISRVMGTQMKPVPLDHEVFSSLFSIREVTYTPLLQFQQPDLTLPALEGISMNGKLAVLYSRYDIGNAWEGEARPFAKGYSNVDGMKLGINIVVYSQTH